MIAMRYLLFILFLILYSQYGFAQIQCTGDAGGANDCGFIGGNPSRISTGSAACVSTSPPGFFVSEGSCSADSNNPSGTIYKCYLSCACPSGEILNTVTSGGITRTACIPDDPSENPDGECNGEPKVYDPVTGTMVCPGSGDGTSSAAASSQTCVVPGDFNGDCVPDDQQASSANNSTPASSPDSGSSGSTASTGGGGDDGGGDNGGGGGGDNGGGDSGGGSGSAAASSTPSGSNSSWTPHSGYGNWIPVSENSNCPNKFQDQSGQWWCAGGNSAQFGSSASQMAISGECDYTSKTYFSCITAQTISGGGSGSNSSWTPVSGYGNWIPVAEDSPCPNKFKDASGKWWCAGGGSGAGSGGAAGSSGSASGGAAGSAASAAGECDQTSRDYLECISSGKSSRGSASSVSSGSASAASSSARSGAFSSLGEKGEFDGEASEKKMDELKEELDQKIADIKADIQGEFGGTISGTGTIQDFCKSNIHRTEVCFGLKKWEPFLDPISAAIFLVACVIAFSIVLRG